MLGASNVGKSTLVARLSVEHAQCVPSPTIGTDYSFIRRESDCLKVWDISGQERYAPFIRLYLPVTDVVLLIYDVADFTSFAFAKMTFETLVAKKKVMPAGAIVRLVGNKNDLSQRSVQLEDVEGFREFIAAHFDVTTHSISATNDDFAQLNAIIPIRQNDTRRYVGPEVNHPPYIALATSFCNNGCVVS